MSAKIYVVEFLEIFVLKSRCTLDPFLCSCDYETAASTTIKGHPHHSPEGASELRIRRLCHPEKLKHCNGTPCISSKLSKPTTLKFSPPSTNYFDSLTKFVLNDRAPCQGFKNAITFESQMTTFETYGIDIIFAVGVDEALLIINDAIYHMSFGTIDILAYFTKPDYAASVGTINDFVKKLAAEYLYYVNVSC